MSYVICYKEASVAIKVLAPDLIVLPLLPLTEYESRNKFSHWVKLWHSIVIGPGLGRDLLILKDFLYILENIADKIVVCDADFFWFLSQDIELYRPAVKKFKRVIFTPNYLEFLRLYKTTQGIEFPVDRLDSLIQRLADCKEEIIECNLFMDIPQLKTVFDYFENPNLCLVIKYQYDLILTNGKGFVVKSTGSFKRCGGLGDILTGLIAFFAHLAVSKSIEVEYALVFAALVNRKACLESFKQMKVGLIASDVLQKVPLVVNGFLDDFYEEDVSEVFRSFE